MDFMITKILQVLALPPASLLIMIAAGFLAALFCRCFGKLLIVGGLFLLYFLSISPVSDALLRPLEKDIPDRLTDHVKAEAIVVLGGGVRDLSWRGAPARPSWSSLERVVGAVKLYRTRPLSLVFMGGNGDPARDIAPDANAMARLAKELGVPEKRIVIENNSRNTLESAQALKKMIKGDRIILVTSAFHMKRASGMFRKQGYTVTPLASGYLYEKRKLSLQSFIPHAYHLHLSSTALSEYMSLAWYSLHREL